MTSVGEHCYTIKRHEPNSSLLNPSCLDYCKFGSSELKWWEIFGRWLWPITCPNKPG